MAPKRPIVLHVIDHMEQGGAQEGLRDLLEANDSEFEHHLFVLRSSSEDKHVESASVYKSISTNRLALFPLVELNTFLNVLKPAIVHAHLARSQLFCALLCSLRRTTAPLIFHERGIILMRGRFLPFLLRFAVKTADLVICVSEAAREGVIRRLHLSHRSEDVIALRNGISPERIRTRANERSVKKSSVKKSNKFQICYAGRLEEEKGCATLIEALRNLNENFHATIIGSGSLASTLETLSEKYQLQDKVSFTGALENALPEIKAADVLVVPSNSDALPRSAVEAFILGTPVIATNVGGIPEVVQHERNGLLFPPGDSTALTQALKQLIDSPNTLSTLSKNAKKDSESFSFKIFLRGLEQAYRKLLSST